jgi:hypothetical protein
MHATVEPTTTLNALASVSKEFSTFIPNMPPTALPSATNAVTSRMIESAYNNLFWDVLSLRPVYIYICMYVDIHTTIGKKTEIFLKSPFQSATLTRSSAFWYSCCRSVSFVCSELSSTW